MFFLVLFVTCERGFSCCICEFFVVLFLCVFLFYLRVLFLLYLSVPTERLLSGVVAEFYCRGFEYESIYTHCFSKDMDSGALDTVAVDGWDPNIQSILVIFLSTYSHLMNPTQTTTYNTQVLSHLLRPVLDLVDMLRTPYHVGRAVSIPNNTPTHWPTPTNTLMWGDHRVDNAGYPWRGDSPCPPELALLRRVSVGVWAGVGGGRELVTGPRGASWAASVEPGRGRRAAEGRASWAASELEHMQGEGQERAWH